MCVDYKFWFVILKSMKKILIWVWHILSVILILASVWLAIAVMVKPSLLTITIHRLNWVIEFLWWKNYILMGGIWFIESIPFINMAFPWQTFMILISWFVAQYHPVTTVLVVVIASILWDMVAYQIWKYKGESILRHYWPTFWLSENRIKKLKDMTHNHAHWALFASKWNSYTRWMLPFIAWSSHMKYKDFMIYNVLWGIVYWSVIVWLSSLFIWNYERAIPYIRRIWVGIFGIVVLWYIIKHYKNERKTW